MFLVNESHVKQTKSSSRAVSDRLREGPRWQLGMLQAPSREET